jgi:hypothetical protein
VRYKEREERERSERGERESERAGVGGREEGNKREPLPTVG